MAKDDDKKLQLQETGDGGTDGNSSQPAADPAEPVYNVILLHPVYCFFNKPPFKEGTKLAVGAGTARYWLEGNICKLAPGVKLPDPKEDLGDEYAPIPAPAWSNKS